MVRTALVALVLTFGGGIFPGSDSLNLLTIWFADQVQAGAIWDPFGGGDTGGGSGSSDAGNDAGSIWDPWG